MPRAGIAVVLLLIATTAAAATRGQLVLASEPIVFDSRFVPHFTPNQIANSNEATRLGLAKWAATARGRSLLEYFTTGAYRISVTEDTIDGGIGSAPQPGIATLVAAADGSVLKNYTLVLNPHLFSVPKGAVALPDQPSTPADVMAVAWAAEMLHIYFYSRGITLPHHPREDFQDEWRTIAAQLGYPALTHDDGDDRPSAARVIFIGEPERPARRRRP